MNYEKHYIALLEKYGYESKPIEYAERHHIIPKCVGGGNEASNLIYLTPRCHLLAHWFLKNMFDEPKLNIAFATMCTREGIKLTPKLYEIARKAVTGRNSPRARPVHTPLGDFDTVAEAATAHKVSKAIISKKAKSKSVLHKGYYHLDEKIIGEEASGHGKHLRKGVQTPLGVFPSVRAAGKAYEIHHSTISKRLKRGDSGYSYLSS
jgi:hypothetical protein